MLIGEHHRLLSRGFLATEKSVGYMGTFLAGGPFSPLMLLLSAGWYDSVHDDLRPYGDLDSLQSKEALVGRSLVNVDSLYLSHDAS